MTGGENSNRRPRLSKSNEHRDVTTTRNIFPRHCVWERLAAPRSEESVKASSDGNAAALVSGVSSPTRFCFTSDCSWKRARNATCFKPVAMAFLFCFFFPPDAVVRGVQKPFEHLRVCIFVFFLPASNREAKSKACFMSSVWAVCRDKMKMRLYV